MPSVAYNLWSIIIVIGAAQAIFLALSILFLKENRRANKYLAFVLLIVGFNLCEYFFSITGLSLRYTFIIGASYPFLYMMGPFYWLFTRATLDKNFNFKPVHLIHFLVSLLCLLFIAPFWFASDSFKVNYILEMAKNNYASIPTEQFVYMSVHIIQTLIYVVLAFKFISKHEKGFLQQFSNSLYNAKVNFLRKFSVGFFCWLGMYLFVLGFLFASKIYRVEIDYVSLLITSFLMFVIGYSVLRKPEIFREQIETPLNIELPVPSKNSIADETQYDVEIATVKNSQPGNILLQKGSMQTQSDPNVRFETEGSEAEKPDVGLNGNENIDELPAEIINGKITADKYKTSSLSAERSKEIKKSLERLFENEKPYLKYDLKLSDLATSLNVPLYHLSQVINQECEQNFYDFVNAYRIDEAKKQLLDSDNDNLKILAIAFDVGFNNKATFNRAFKKATMLTPSEYKKKFNDN